MQFKFAQFEKFSVIEFEIEGVIEPSSLSGAVSALKQAGVALDQGLILSGRGPIWLFCAFAHELHPAQWVACHDPRLGGAVVVQSHVRDVEVGQLIKF
jgi:CRISPR-associated protein Csx3